MFDKKKFRFKNIVSLLSGQLKSICYFHGIPEGQFLFANKTYESHISFYNSSQLLNGKFIFINKNIDFRCLSAYTYVWNYSYTYGTVWIVIIQHEYNSPNNREAYLFIITLKCLYEVINILLLLMIKRKFVWYLRYRFTTSEGNEYVRRYFRLETSSL